MKLFEKALVFSVFSHSRSEVENIDIHVSTLDLLTRNGVQYVELLGSYEDIREKSILVTDVKVSRPTVEMLCSANKQECYLELDVDRHAELVFPNGNRRSVGYLVPVSEAEAKTNGNWSYNYNVNQFYITRGV